MSSVAALMGLTGSISSGAEALPGGHLFGMALLLHIRGLFQQV